MNHLKSLFGRLILLVLFSNHCYLAKEKAVTYLGIQLRHKVPTVTGFFRGSKFPSQISTFLEDSNFRYPF